MNPAVKNHKTTFEFPEVRIVEASAGSGKTYALARRYIQLLLNSGRGRGQSPKGDSSLNSGHSALRTILAITFTNKASFEMKARILEFLKVIALEKFPADQLGEMLEPLGIDGKTAQTRAFAAMEELIRNYNYFQVQTIDKFINALLSGCAFKIGLTANFKIKTNSSEYLEYSLDQLIDRAHTDKELLKVFQDFLHHYLYLENRTGWFPKEDMLEIIANLFAQNTTYGADFLKSEISSQKIIKSKKVILEEMRELKAMLTEGTDGRFMNSLDKFLMSHEKGFDVDSLSDYFSREAVPVKKGVKVSAGLVRKWGKMHQMLKALCEEEAYSLFNPYIEIYDHAKKELQAVSTKDDVMFLEELNERAGMLFDDEYVTVQELYYRLATRFRHYLIDEFQDTSRLQWHNIEKMAEEALSTGGSLFYVGDRKQAIYGFRGGDVALFDGIKDEFGAFNVTEEALTRNWRSHKQIVDFNNHVFSVDNLKQFIRRKEDYELQKRKKNPVDFSENDFNDLERIFHSSQQTCQEQRSGGYVHVEYVDIEKKEEREEEITARMIRLLGDLKKRFSFRDIAILTRNNAQVEQLTNALLDEDIPVESERTLNIQENEAIGELISFLQFLNSPIDNIAFSKFILGEIFAKAAGIGQEEMHHFIFSAREKISKEKDLYIYMLFREHYPELWDGLIQEFFKNAGLYPLYELMVSVYHKLQCLSHFPGLQGFFMHFLELIKKGEEDHSDIASFLESFENIKGDDLYVHVTDSDAIKIMTVHKAKGLEFPVCIIPYLGMDVQIGMQGADNKQSYILRQEGPFIRLLRLKDKYLGYSGELSRIHAQEYKKALLSELNNVYVALTRPQCELYAYIPKKVGNSFNIARFLFPEDLYISGRQGPFTLKEQHRSTPYILKPSRYYDWIDYLKEEFSEYDEIINRKQRNRGEVIHFILAEIGNINGNDPGQMMDQALAKARCVYPQIEDFTQYVTDAQGILNDKKLTPFFDVTDGLVFTEKEIVNEKGHVKRIDRLLLRDKEAVVLDYKTSRAGKEKYLEQIREYVRIVKGMYPEKAVKGFILYLDDLELVEI